ncbi:unnamed protein product, partial [Brassica oleracea]
MVIAMIFALFLWLFGSLDFHYGLPDCSMRSCLGINLVIMVFFHYVKSYSM